MSRKPLSLELVSIVAEVAANAGDTRTVAKIARVSHAVNDVVTPILYRRLVLTRRNAPRLFRGLKRTAMPKDHRRTKPEWNADLETFTRKFGRFVKAAAGEGELAADASDEDFTGGRWPSADWEDSDPETDDELSPDWGSEDAAAKNAGKDETEDDAGWERRRELLKLCRHLTVLQVPSRPLMEDLMGAADYGSDEDDDSDEDARASSTLFPNLTHLAIGPRVLRTTSDYYARELFGDEPVHGFLRFMKRAFGSPKHICMTCHADPVTMQPEYVMRVFKKPADSIKASEVHFVLFEEYYGEQYHCTRDMRPQLIATFLPAGAETLTVHNLRYPGEREGHSLRGANYDAGLGLPLLEENDHTIRVFYDNGGEGKHGAQTISKRIDTIMQALSETAPTVFNKTEKIEHIDAGNNIADQPDQSKAEEEIRTQVNERIAADPSKYMSREEQLEDSQCLPQDKDEGLEAAHKAAVAACEESEARVNQLRHEHELLKTESRKLQSEARAKQTPVATPNVRAATEDTRKVLVQLNNAYMTSRQALSAAQQQGQPTDSLKRELASAKRKMVQAGRAHEANMRRVSEAAAPCGQDASLDSASEDTLRAKRAQLERQCADAKRAVEAAQEALQPLTHAKWATLSAAREARMANLKARLLAEAPVDRAAPADRVAFSSGDDAVPCTVCGRRHTSADPQGIRAQVELAWAL